MRAGHVSLNRSQLDIIGISFAKNIDIGPEVTLHLETRQEAHLEAHGRKIQSKSHKECSEKWNAPRLSEHVEQ